MWFGDLVTMKWWQDTWLNESFADYMGYQVAHEAGVLGSWPDFSLNRKPSRTSRTRAGRPTRSPRTPSTWSTSTRVQQLRHDHLRQGRIGAAAAGDLAGLGHLRGRHQPLPDPAPVRERRARRLPRRARLASPTATCAAGRRPTCAPPASTPSGSTRDGDVTGAEPRGVRPHRLSIAALDGRAVRATTTGRPRPRARSALPDFAGLPVIPNAADEAYAALLLDDLSWQAVLDGPRASPTRCCAAVTWTNASDPRPGRPVPVGRLPRRRRAAPGRRDRPGGLRGRPGPA